MLHNIDTILNNKKKSRQAVITNNNNNKEKYLLIVDDSPYNIFVLQQLISFDPSLKDYIVDTALNGQEAIERVR